MASPGHIGQLSAAAWQRLRDLTDRFEQAWEEAEAVDLESFLPPPEDPLRRVALDELIKTDLEIRWRRGRDTHLEWYLERFPELGKVSSLPTELLYEEYRVRQLYGDKPPLAEYESRFPGQFQQLQQLIQQQPCLATTQADTARRAEGLAGDQGSGGQADAGDLGSVLPIGGYRLLNRIGGGGFGEVWRAEAPGGVEVAIKVLPGAVEQAVAQRELEALELIKRLRHSFLLQIQAYWSLPDRLIIVMDLADGSLRDRLRQCRQQGLSGIPLPELLTYMREAAEALDYLHGKQVQHRDVKPDNILLLGSHVKLADFGLARVIAGRRLASVSGSGTPAYMAPELWRRKVSLHSDQYSLAATYVELRRGRTLFSSRKWTDVMCDHLEKTPELSPLGEVEQQVLLRALAKDPDGRHASCLDFLETLEQAVRRVSPGPQPFPPKLTEAKSDRPTEVGPAGGAIPEASKELLRSTVVYTPAAGEEEAPARECESKPEIDAAILTPPEPPAPVVPASQRDTAPARAQPERAPTRPPAAWRRARPRRSPWRPLQVYLVLLLAAAAATLIGWYVHWHSDDYRAHFERGHAYLDSGDHDGAIAEFTEALRLNPEFAPAYSGRGRARLSKRHYEDARDDFSQAIRLNPNDAGAYNGRGRACLLLGKWNEAIADCTAAIGRDNRLASAYSNRGAAYFQLGEPEPAIADCDEAIRLDANLAAAYYHRGHAYLGQSQYSKAIKDFDDLLRLDPEDAGAYASRAQAYLLKGELPQAVADCTTAIRIDGNNAWAYLYRAQAYEQQNEKDKAKRDYDMVRKINPRLMD